MAQKTKKHSSAQAEQVRSLEHERDLLEKKLHRLHDRYDALNRTIEWAFKHPIRFALGRVYHTYIKRDQKV